MSHPRLARFLALACLTLLTLMPAAPAAASFQAHPICDAPASPMDVPWGG